MNKHALPLNYPPSLWMPPILYKWTAILFSSTKTRATFCVETSSLQLIRNLGLFCTWGPVIILVKRSRHKFLYVGFFWGIQGQFLWSIDSFHFFEHVPSVEGGDEGFFFLVRFARSCSYWLHWVEFMRWNRNPITFSGFSLCQSRVTWSFQQYWCG